MSIGEPDKGRLTTPSSTTVNNLVSWLDVGGKILGDSGVPKASVVLGPSSVTSGNFALYDGTTGKLLKEMTFTDWTDWTPVVTQGGNVTYAPTNNRYTRIGDMVIVVCLLTITGSGSAGSAIVVTGFPVNIANASAYKAMGSGLFLNSGTSFYHGAAYPIGSADGCAFIADGHGNNIGALPNYGLANGDSIGFTVTYEA